MALRNGDKFQGWVRNRLTVLYHRCNDVHIPEFAVVGTVPSVWLAFFMTDDEARLISSQITGTRRDDASG